MTRHSTSYVVRICRFGVAKPLTSSTMWGHSELTKENPAQSLLRPLIAWLACATKNSMTSSGPAARTSHRPFRIGAQRSVERLQGRLRRLALRIVPTRYQPALFRLYLRVMARLYAGDQCSCPCCGGSYRAFIPYTIVQPHLVCPGCGSFARHRLLFLYLSEKTNLFSDNCASCTSHRSIAFSECFASVPTSTTLAWTWIQPWPWRI
jgi:hypothetical protein